MDQELCIRSDCLSYELNLNLSFLIFYPNLKKQQTQLLKYNKL